MAERTLVVASAKSSPADSISAVQVEAVNSFYGIAVRVEVLHSLIEVVISTPVLPSSSNAAVISDVQPELALEAQSSAAFETSSEAWASSVAASEIS